jgi:hypothetical protein
MSRRCRCPGGRCWWGTWPARACPAGRSGPAGPRGCSAARPRPSRSPCPITCRCSPPTWPGRGAGAASARGCPPRWGMGGGPTRSWPRWVPRRGSSASACGWTTCPRCRRPGRGCGSRTWPGRRRWAHWPSRRPARPSRGTEAPGMGYAHSITVDLPYEQAVPRVKEAFAAQGFGTLTEIDVAATLRDKLGEQMEPYLILGACNPQLAHRALRAEPGHGREQTGENGPRPRRAPWGCMLPAGRQHPGAGDERPDPAARPRLPGPGHRARMAGRRQHQMGGADPGRAAAAVLALEHPRLHPVRPGLPTPPTRPTGRR